MVLEIMECVDEHIHQGFMDLANSKISVMGSEQAASVLVTLKKAQYKNRKKMECKRRKKIKHLF